jgi:phage terminase large subunit
MQSAFELTLRQQEQRRLMAGPATHVMAFGGSRSGKTFGFVRGIMVRAFKAPGSRHLIARYRLNHVLQSIWHDTLPKVMATCWPDVAMKQDKSSWLQTLPNGSELWFGGLDDRSASKRCLATSTAPSSSTRPPKPA